MSKWLPAALQRKLPPSAEAIVTACYQEILGRQPDPGGLAAHTKILEAADASDAIGLMLKGFLGSEEYARKLSAPAYLLRGLQGEGARVNGEKVAHIVSLGTHCLTSSILKRWNLKNYSLPFDWIFSSPGMVMDCFLNDFQVFLDKSCYSPMQRPTGEPGAQHLWYLNHLNVRDCFAHRDPSQDGDYQYTVRTVERFRQLAGSDSVKLFVMISGPEHRLDKHFTALSEGIRKLTRHSAFIAITLARPSGESGCTAMKLLTRDADHSLYEFTPVSTNNGVEFTDLLDELAILRLIHRYALAISALP